MPDDHLAVDATASLALGAWYHFGEEVLDAVRASALSFIRQALNHTG